MDTIQADERNSFRFFERLAASFAAILWCVLLTHVAAAADEYEVVPSQTPVRGHLYLSDGPVEVSSSNASWGNRFKLGGEIHLGKDYQYLLGLTFYDLFTTGESSPDIGGISRFGSDVDVGYFILPDRLWLKYSFFFGNVSTDRIFGNVGNIGNGLSIGYRFYSNRKVNVAVEASYLHLRSETEPTYNSLGAFVGDATYPLANLWSLGFRVGFDIGGRQS
jgi:hypothetical protein